MTDRLKNKVAVVTGSGRGVGRDIALTMAREGAMIVTNNRKRGDSVGDAETTAGEITSAGGKAEPFFGDISDFEVAHKLIQTAVDQFGRIDILVNNAGFYRPLLPWEVSEEDWDNVLNICLKGTFNCSRHAVPFMMEQKWGRIINCSSGCWISCTEASHYAAAKAGIVGYTRALATDLAQYGITCNAYHPYAETLMTALNGGMEEMERILNKRLELGLISRDEYEFSMHRPGPEGIGAMISYLATDEAANINGKVFYTSAGRFSIYTDEVKKKTIIKDKGLWSVEELIKRVPEELMV